MSWWTIAEKLMSVTTDNASNMDTMFDELEVIAQSSGMQFDSNNFRTRCFAHIMNLACKDIIQSVGDGDHIAYPSDDENDGDEEKRNSKELPVVAKLRKAVVAIRKSPQRREMFAKQCNVFGVKSKNLLRNVRTRFNSTLTMLERAKELKLPLDMTLNCISELRNFSLEDWEWEMVDELIKLLMPFREATIMLSNEHSPTLSRVTSVYQLLFDHLEAYTDGSVDQRNELDMKIAKNARNG